MNSFIITASVSFFASLVLHELGHYIAALICAVPVRRAGLGWGPKVYGARVRGVEYQLRLLPVGAYVQMDMKALQSRPLVQQLFVIGAGIGVNLILCVLTWGSLFSALNLALAIGNLIPLYQLDGWKSGMVICRSTSSAACPGHWLTICTRGGDRSG